MNAARLDELRSLARTLDDEVEGLKRDLGGATTHHLDDVVEAVGPDLFERVFGPPIDDDTP